MQFQIVILNCFKIIYSKTVVKSGSKFYEFLKNCIKIVDAFGEHCERKGQPELGNILKNKRRTIAGNTGSTWATDRSRVYDGEMFDSICNVHNCFGLIHEASKFNVECRQSTKKMKGRKRKIIICLKLGSKRNCRIPYFVPI